MNYKQKMVIELVDLREKIIKLESLDKITTEEERNLLDRQLKAMSEYYTILHDRIMIMLDD